MPDPSCDPHTETSPEPAPGFRSIDASPPSSSDSAARVIVLGGFDVRTADGTSIHFALPAQRVIAMLALLRRPAERRVLAGRLWPDHDETYALTRLREALFQVRKSTGLLLDTSGSSVCLRPSVSVDLHDVETSIRSLIIEPIRSVGESIETLLAARCLEPELLADWHDVEWIEPERFRWNEFRVASLETLMAVCRSEGADRQAIELAHTALMIDPYRETIHHKLIEIYLDHGNRAQALRRYELYRRLMIDDLGLEPSPEISAALERRCGVRSST